ncbi:magnesium/cobalt transporter CorA [Dokdonia sp. Hel_I_53]|uniref:magnesium/cobalt transporter CorA n=1 Tax=Dokdonia sp. Hel_I_53 TaxID=1566287 RepID=UPI00119B9B21|nr:magnesium/cobalt transporter CorA [Dokdonia sp. Hel_I_53]TVZ51542.1 magnesium transporter [Dokdonia sp. Hel_I_53]
MKRLAKNLSKVNPIKLGNSLGDSLKKNIIKEKMSHAPGHVVYTGSKEIKDVLIDVFDYNTHNFDEETISELNSYVKDIDEKTVTWINVNGLSDTAALNDIAIKYDLHTLVMEDVANTSQRPKLDEYPDQLFVVFKMLYYDGDNKLNTEHISLILGKAYVLLMQEYDGDVFDGVRDRIRHSKGRLRSQGADYLMYALMDAVIDNYFMVIETLSDKLEVLEEQIYECSSENYSQDIQRLKKEVVQVRRSIFPLREVVNKLEKVDNHLMSKKTQLFVRDLYDHTIQVIETVEIYRDTIAGLMDMNSTNIANRMNEVMKVLTIVATIFIPMTFLAGIYGMNFEYIPELTNPNGYFYFWGAMVVIFFASLIYFKRKKWL